MHRTFAAAFCLFAAGITPRADALDLLSGLVGYWAFDEGSGTTAQDSSTKNNDAALISAGWGTGMFGGGLSLDGTGCARITTFADLPINGSARTVLAWVKPTTAPGYPWEGIFTYGGWGYASMFSLERRENGGAYLMGHSLDVSGSPGTLATGQWTHVAATYDGTTVRLWINGVLDSWGNLALTTPNSVVQIGHTTPNDGWHAGFRGVLDEVALYGRALSQAEIQEAMAAPIPEPGSATLLLAAIGSLFFPRRRSFL
jgi:hypothetical protein